MRRTHSLFVTALLASSALATPAFAEEQPAAPEAAEDQPGSDRSRNIDEDDIHTLPDIIVSAGYLDDLNILAGTSVIEGDDLTQELEPQIGEILTKLPGVSATSFTPGASRPVLRGFQGPRILVLNDGVGLVDVSTTSADHAVTVEPLLLERIEVLRGPAVLLYGGNAIGGAVNSFDKRIPRAVPDDLHVDILGSYGTAANERSIGATLDLPITDNLVLHVDGNYRNTDDLEVGGFVLSPELRAEQLEVAAEETEEGNLDEAAEALELAELRNRIPNTATETYSFGSGLSWFGDGGMLGMSVSYFDSLYGVPERPGAEHAHEEGEEEEGEEEEEEGPVTIGLEQVKVDFVGEVYLSGFFEKLRLRTSYANFEQIEFEGDEVGTVFSNEGIEARAELIQRERNGWRGASGIQYSFRDFSAIGAEAFVPPNLTSQFGIFTVQEISTGDWDIEGALRYDRVDSDSSVLGIERNFNSVSGAIGAGYNFAEGVKAGVNLSRAERAPGPEELFSNGPHIATQAFEIGNPNFDTESSIGGEIYLRVDQPNWQFAITAYYNDFDNFIIDIPTGAEEDGLPVFQFIQNDAEFYGFEAQGSAIFARSGGFEFVVDGVADYTRASLDGLGPVPRIPPLRLLGGLEAQSDTLNGRVEVEWFDDQNRNATFETETDGFTLVNAQVAWKPLGADGAVTLLASANNIFDVVGRRAASFTKDFAPLAGRDFRVSAKVSF